MDMLCYVWLMLVTALLEVVQGLKNLFLRPDGRLA